MRHVLGKTHELFGKTHEIFEEFVGKTHEALENSYVSFEKRMEIRKNQFKFEKVYENVRGLKFIFHGKPIKVK